mgnify:CR=1 FL=1
MVNLSTSRTGRAGPVLKTLLYTKEEEEHNWIFSADQIEADASGIIFTKLLA